MPNHNLLVALTLSGLVMASACSAASSGSNGDKPLAQKPTTDGGECFAFRRAVITFSEETQTAKFRLTTFMDAAKAKARALNADRVSNIAITTTIAALPVTGKSTPKTVTVEVRAVAEFCAPVDQNQTNSRRDSQAPDVSIVVYDVQNATKVDVPLEDFIVPSSGRELSKEASHAIFSMIKENMLPDSSVQKMCAFVPSRAIRYKEGAVPKVIVLSDTCRAWRIGEPKDIASQVLTIDIDKDYQMLSTLLGEKKGNGP